MAPALGERTLKELLSLFLSETRRNLVTIYSYGWKAASSAARAAARRAGKQQIRDELPGPFSTATIREQQRPGIMRRSNLWITPIAVEFHLGAGVKLRRLVSEPGGQSMAVPVHVRPLLADFATGLLQPAHASVTLSIQSLPTRPGDGVSMDAGGAGTAARREFAGSQSEHGFKV